MTSQITLSLSHIRIFKNLTKPEMENNDISARHMSSYVNALQQFSARRGKQGDLMGAASGYGGGYSYCPQGIPIELALCLLLAGFAVAFGILYRAVTKITGRRRRRSVATDKDKTEDAQDKIADMFWWGRSHIIFIVVITSHS